MRNKKIAEALGEIDPNYIAKAAEPCQTHWRGWMYTAAAVLAVVLLVGILWQWPDSPERPIIQGTTPADLGKPVSIQSPDTLQLANLVAAPGYPKMAQMPNYDDYESRDLYYADYQQWRASQKEQYNQPSNYADSLDAFWARSLPQFLSGQTENAAYSPVNVYMALAMLAETADGNSRQQILSLLGLSTIEELRIQVSHVWNAHYCNDGASTIVLGNSIWIDSAFSYKQATVDTLAETYFSSVFHGGLGTEEMNTQLRQWIDSQTGNLLQEHTNGLKLDPRTVMALASTVYFSGKWESGFPKKNTEEGIFQGLENDVKTQFMRQTFSVTSYYWGKDFGALRLSLSGQNDMWLILPDEGKTVDDVLASGEYLQMCTGSWKDQDLYTVNLSLPKFDISGEMDLVDGLKSMGMTDVFDPEVSDFSALTDESIFVNKVDHACRVAVDEEGCVAAAYTVMALYGTGMPSVKDEIDFILDRPFLFVITSRDQLPLFAGVVNQP